MPTATHPPSPPGPRQGSATRLSPIEGDGSQLSVPRSGGMGTRHGVASTLRAQLNLGMDQPWPDALGSPTCAPSDEDILDERVEELSSLKRELAESYSAIAGES